jgi:hypothetical protein
MRSGEQWRTGRPLRSNPSGKTEKQKFLGGGQFDGNDSSCRKPDFSGGGDEVAVRSGNERWESGGDWAGGDEPAAVSGC